MLNLLKREEGDIEMHSNPIGAGKDNDLSGAKVLQQKARNEAERLAAELEHKGQMQGQMNDEYRRLKAAAARKYFKKLKDNETYVAIYDRL